MIIVVGAFEILSSSVFYLMIFHFSSLDLLFKGEFFAYSRNSQTSLHFYNLRIPKCKNLFIFPRSLEIKFKILVSAAAPSNRFPGLLVRRPDGLAPALHRPRTRSSSVKESTKLNFIRPYIFFFCTCWVEANYNILNHHPMQWH